MVGKGIKSCVALAYRLVSFFRGKLAVYLIWMKANVGLLTDDIILQAPTREKPYTIRDGRGLFVLVHPNGSRYFQMRATVAGKRKLMQLGVYPQISIEEARALSSGRLQAELEEAESGLPTGALDESASLFMDPAPNVTEAIAAQLRVEEPTAAVTSKFISKEVTELKEERHTINLDDDMDLFEEKPRGATPKVNLAYDQLVYIPSTLPKTFSQKFVARYHPKLLLGQFYQYVLNQFWQLKAKLLHLVKRAYQQLMLGALFCHEKIKITFNKLLIKIGFLLNGIKINFQKQRFKTLNFKIENRFVLLSDLGWGRLRFERYFSQLKNFLSNIALYLRKNWRMKYARFFVYLIFDLFITWAIERYLDTGDFDWKFYVKIYFGLLVSQLIFIFRNRFVASVLNYFNLRS